MSSVAPNEHYALTCQAMRVVLDIFLKDWPELGKPRFALPPEDCVVIGSLRRFGHNLIRNRSAHALLHLWLDMEKEFAGIGVRDTTVEMLRACCREAGLETDVVEPAELGMLVPAARPRKPN